MMTIFVFGNPDIMLDSLPLRIMSRLRDQFPWVAFEVRDPHEEWDFPHTSNIPEELFVIDTVVGISEVTVFKELNDFQLAPRISMHDFDALANLRFLQKIGRLKKVTVIAVPPVLSGIGKNGEDREERKILEDVENVLRNICRNSIGKLKNLPLKKRVTKTF